MRTLLYFVLALGLAGCGEGDVPPPQGAKFASSRGYEYHDHTVKTNSGELMWANVVLKDYKKKRSSNGDLEIKTLKQSGCKLPRLTPNEHAVQTVTIEESRLASPLYILREKTFEDGAAQLKKRYMETGKVVGLGPQYSRPDTVGLVNVVVTETEKPVLLVLSSSRHTLWNIHSADGVEIDKIVLLSNVESGLANVPAETDVFALSGEQATTRCKIIPARRPEPHWKFYQRSQEKSKSSPWQETFKDNVRRGNAFYNWLDRNYDVREHGLIDASRLDAVLVGPKPDKKVPYRSLDGATVLWPETPHLLTGPSRQASNPRPIGEKYVVAEVTRQAGGDLKNLLRQ